MGEVKGFANCEMGNESGNTSVTLTTAEPVFLFKDWVIDKKHGADVASLETKSGIPKSG